VFTFTLTAHGQDVLDERQVTAIERETVLQLFATDVSSVSKDLASENATTVGPLLRQLFIYSRAGHQDRVRKTLKQLEQASDWKSCEQPYIVRRKIKNAIQPDDLLSWRFYYGNLCPRDGEGAETFLRLWEKAGDSEDLDRWLQARGSDNDEWFRFRVHHLAKSGRADEILNPLAASIKSNPRDLDRAQRYLLINNWAGEVQDVAWLADTCHFATAYEYYELGNALQRKAPQAAARLLKKALTLPFTDRDAELVRQRGFRYVAMMPARLNYEKQLSFWIKLSLAETYQNLRQPQEAQALVEELVTMKGADIVTQDVHQLAGSVQAQSGQRVVEAGVLGAEVPQRESVSYWLERAAYYRGRKEYELECDTYRQALEVFLINPNDPKWEAQRFEIVRSFTFSLVAQRHEHADWHSRIERLLRREFNRAAPNTPYAFNIGLLIINGEFELDDLRHSLFVAQPEGLTRLLASRIDWKNDEEYLLDSALRGDRITTEQKNRIWTSLERLVGVPGSSRAYRLARVMSDHGSLQRAVPLFLGCLKRAHESEFINRDEVLGRLIEAYCQKGSWRSAEELLLENKDWFWESVPRYLGMIACAAGQHGATDDALRLWKLKANLDRRDLSDLELIARTEAKPALRAFYQQMKQADPLTLVPDLALRLLN
jgi:tetratricopeptide (TPR) repeat protein